MENTNSIENIKKALIRSVIESDPEYFKPFLFSEKVKCEPDKDGFYKFFKYMLHAAKKISDGDLVLKIEGANSENKQNQHYCFYDTVHLYPRITLIVGESSNSIHIDIYPF